MRKEKLVDLAAERIVFAAGDFLSDNFESERSVADPSVKIVGVNGVRAGDDYSGLGIGLVKVKERMGRVNEQTRQRILNHLLRC